MYLCARQKLIEMEEDKQIKTHGHRLLFSCYERVRAKGSGRKG